MRLRVRKVAVLLSAVLVVTWIYMSTLPTLQQSCGYPCDLRVLAPRVKLKDGRHLAYIELGVRRELAKHKIIYVHGFGNSKINVVIAHRLPQAIFEELGVCIISFDRPGYEESDPDPKRTLKSLSQDIEELADLLALGDKFYLSGFSLGGQLVWGSLKYIPHRLAGVVLIAPAMNYWWKGFPESLLKDAFEKQLPEDQWAQRVTHYAPWLTYWWNTQKFFPSSSVAAFSLQSQPKHQGVYESLHQDMIIGWSAWEFSPMDLENPIKGPVHLWQGDNDHLVPVTLQRYIAKKLPWIKYHEVHGAGHMFALTNGKPEASLRSLFPKK